MSDTFQEALIKRVAGRFGLARGARRQRKAWGERGFASGTPGSVEYQVPAREVGDSLFIISDLWRLVYRTLRALGFYIWSPTWGSARKASLTPGFTLSPRSAG